MGKSIILFFLMTPVGEEQVSERYIITIKLPGIIRDGELGRFNDNDIIKILYFHAYKAIEIDHLNRDQVINIDYGDLQPLEYGNINFPNPPPFYIEVKRRIGF